MKHKNFYEEYSEIMYNERDAIREQLIKIGGGMWHFDKAVELMTNAGTCMQVEDVLLDADKFVTFNVDTGVGMEYGWECFNFAWGELSKILDALPEVEEVRYKGVLADLERQSMNINVRMLLKESPFVINGEEVSDILMEEGRVHVVTPQSTSGSECFETSDLERLRDHINVQVLRRRDEYKRVTNAIRSFRDSCYNFCEHNNVGELVLEVVFVGKRIPVSVLDISYGENVGLRVLVSINGTPLEAKYNDDTIVLIDKDLNYENISEIAKFFETDIMSSHTSHDDKLVRDINDAWNNPKYHSRFGFILEALADMYNDECEEKIGHTILHYEDAMENASDILEEICDDQDLHTILTFIRYKGYLTH